MAQLLGLSDWQHTPGFHVLSATVTKDGDDLLLNLETNEGTLTFILDPTVAEEIYAALHIRRRTESL